MKRTMSVLVAAVVMFGALPPSAQGQSKTAQGALPNGKPFVQIQSQFAAVDEKILALQAQISDVESRLQAQINQIYGTLADIQGQVGDLKARATTLEGAVAVLKEQVSDNQAAIAALQDAVSRLQTMLAEAQAAIASNTGDIAALNREADNIKTLLAVHQSRIEGLEQETKRANEFLATMAGATCLAGEAIQDVGPTGLVKCTKVAGDLSSVTMYAMGSVGPWSPSTAELGLSCPTGYTLSASGYETPWGFDYYYFVAGVSYYYHTVALRNLWTWPWPYEQSWQAVPDYVAIPSPYHTYRYFSPVSVIANTTVGNRALVRVQYAPFSYTGVRMIYVYANCMKRQ